jgi:hypothetical protein
MGTCGPFVVGGMPLLAMLGDWAQAGGWGWGLATAWTLRLLLGRVLHAVLDVCAIRSQHHLRRLPAHRQAHLPAEPVHQVQEDSRLEVANDSTSQRHHDRYWTLQREVGAGSGRVHRHAAAYTFGCCARDCSDRDHDARVFTESGFGELLLEHFELPADLALDGCTHWCLIGDTGYTLSQCMIIPFEHPLGRKALSAPQKAWNKVLSRVSCAPFIRCIVPFPHGLRYVVRECRCASLWSGAS